MSDDELTRTIEDAFVEDHFEDEAWLVLVAVGDRWPVKWDPDYAEDLISDVLGYYGVDYDPDPNAVDVSALVGEELPVRENEYGDWEGVDSDVIREGVA